MIGPVPAWSGTAKAGRRTRAGGFTLLEVIAAVLLLAITFASLMRVAGSSLALTARSAERSEAAMWGRSLLDSAFVLEPIRVGRSSGRFDERYHWQLDVRPVQPPATAQASGPQPRAPASPLKLYRLDLDVMWTSAGHDYTARFSTLRVGGPKPQGADS
ncbi:prepilin-type cleavage/methylation domain-containing protein [Frateuria edaphi]|uniref:type IV pilus modification PilV family protein n=1 Tax=Frateuria edaphi TaxID=2898793 RepID=UPI001E4E884D|nr:prepilin-type cleavage/methylation domain-containing protein [Frateuria edaphi]UGB45372.1 prepilin-type cleavage/methylation domain-containing protein [Frateuria edaphi]